MTNTRGNASLTDVFVHLDVDGSWFCVLRDVAAAAFPASDSTAGPAVAPRNDDFTVSSNDDFLKELRKESAMLENEDS